MNHPYHSKPKSGCSSFVFTSYVPSVSSHFFYPPNVRVLYRTVRAIIIVIMIMILKNKNIRGDYFRFGSIFIKKIIKLKFFFKKNRNRVKPTGFGSVWFGFLGQKPVQTSLDRFWLGFSGLTRFFFRFFVGFGSVRFGLVFSVFCL
jgi:hypothetical protein